MKNQIAIVLFLFTISLMGQNFHTEYKYTDSINKGISIQNSYPKGGQKYTNKNNFKEYVFLVFWTSITNETDSNLELEIDFSNDSFTIPTSPNVIFNLYLPNEEMTLKKEDLLNYGLDLKTFLHKNIDKPSELTKTIHPNQSCLFYTIALSNQGINGAVRAGFELNKQDLIYKINDYKVTCGKILVK